jgi:hypothetical protein
MKRLYWKAAIAAESNSGYNSKHNFASRGSVDRRGNRWHIQVIEHGVHRYVNYPNGRLRPGTNIEAHDALKSEGQKGRGCDWGMIKIASHCPARAVYGPLWRMDIVGAARALNASVHVERRIQLYRSTTLKMPQSRASHPVPGMFRMRRKEPQVSIGARLLFAVIPAMANLPASYRRLQKRSRSAPEIERTIIKETRPLPFLGR